MWTKEEVLRFDVCAAPLEDLQLFTVSLSTLVTGYATESLTVPEWIADKQHEARRELTVRLQAEKEQQLRQRKARTETLLIPKEQRARIKEDIAQMERDLASGNYLLTIR